VEGLGQRDAAGDLPTVVEVVGGGEGAQAEVAHAPAGPLEGVGLAGDGDAGADDPAVVVDGLGLADGVPVAERAEVDELAPGQLGRGRGRRRRDGEQAPEQQRQGGPDDGRDVTHGLPPPRVTMR
jgi:hypothetical protein